MSDSQSSALAPVPAKDGPLVALLTLAVEKNIGVEGLKKLVALQRSILDRDAALEFADAMAEFQRVCPPIHQDKTVGYVTNKGQKVHYTHATLSEIARVVAPILGRLGLSYSWDQKIDDKALLTCTCTVRHRNGHSQTATFCAPIGGMDQMSDMQKAAGTLTYAKRQSLVQVLGLTTTDSDTSDGSEHETGGGPTLNADQAIYLKHLLAGAPDAAGETGRFLAWVGVATIEEIPASRFEDVNDKLTRKAKQLGWK